MQLPKRTDALNAIAALRDSQVAMVGGDVFKIVSANRNTPTIIGIVKRAAMRIWQTSYGEVGTLRIVTLGSI